MLQAANTYQNTADSKDGKSKNSYECDSEMPPGKMAISFGHGNAPLMTRPNRTLRQEAQRT